jgi:tRNA (guanine37-N1)-methyltransferase
MLIDVLTIFKEMFDGPLSCGNIRIAKEKGLVDIRTWDIRDFSNDKHRRVDDYPYGGGPGMVMKVEPIFRAVKACSDETAKVILLSPQGRLFTQALARELSEEKHLIFICGRYKGIDERVREHVVDEEISIGDYVLSGGELAAMVIIDSIVRLIPGVPRNRESVLTDSFEEDALDTPYYTRPPDFEGMKVPEVLLSGNHALIQEWRKKKQEERTKVWIEERSKVCGYHK